MTSTRKRRRKQRIFRALKIPIQYPLVLLIKAGCRQGRAFLKKVKFWTVTYFITQKNIKKGEPLLCLGRIVNFAFRVRVGEPGCIIAEFFCFFFFGGGGQLHFVYTKLAQHLLNSKHTVPQLQKPTG
jgi:hypothetical protein